MKNIYFVRNFVLGILVILMMSVMHRTAWAGVGNEFPDQSNDVRASGQVTNVAGQQLEWVVEQGKFTVYIRTVSGERNLVFSEAAAIMNSNLLQLSPQGDQIVFATAQDLAFTDSIIWLINADGSNRRKLVESADGFWVTNPIWSPDNHQLAYVKVMQPGEDGQTPTSIWIYDIQQASTRFLSADPQLHLTLFFGGTKAIEWPQSSYLNVSVDKGNEQVMYQIDTLNGQIASIVHESMVVEPSGTFEHDCQNMIKPVSVRDYDGTIGRGYTTGYLDKYTSTSYDGLGSHPGVDIAGGSGSIGAGTSVRAIADGYVYAVGTQGSWGNHVVLKHDGNNCEGTIFSIYAHMRDTPNVQTGNNVTRGTELGKVGSTGGSTGAHLHFQIDKNNTNHPYWIPDPTAQYRAGQCQSTTCRWDSSNHVVNNPDTDNHVKDHTHNPMRFVQDRAGSGDSQPSCTTSEGVILYEGSNYTGRCSRFTEDDGNIGDNTIGNDAASSIRIIGNYEATVYADGNYGSTESRFTGDDPDFGNDSINHDRASSIRVRRRDAGGNSNCDGAPGVYLYENGNFQGKCSKFTGDSPDAGSWYVGNDTVSSIRINGSYEATLYEHGSYNGASSTFSGEDSDLGNDTIGNDHVSSLRVRQRDTSGGSSNCSSGDGVFLYENSNYQGRCSKFTSDSSSPGSWYVGNDAVTSIKIVGNYEATLFEHDAYQGAQSTFQADDTDVGNDTIGNDHASSLRVRTRSANAVTCETGQFLAEYFNDRDLSGSPVLRRCESQINNDWSLGGPGNGVANDNFSVRWRGDFWIASDALYRFTARSDDGFRVSVDGFSLINQSRDMGATTFTEDRNLAAGVHAIQMDYYEAGGHAVAQLAWQQQQSTPSQDSDGGESGYGGNADGTINPANDRDEFFFNGTSGQAITIRMDKRDSALDSYLELYNPDGSLLAQNDDSDERNPRIAITLRQNGRHKIIAHGFQTSTGGYRLTLNQESTGDPDDERWIAFGATLQGTISPSNDRDTYYVAGVAGRAISLRMNKVDAGLDSFLELYSPAGVKVEDNDDGGGDQNSWIIYTLPTDGTYRIQARSYNLTSSGRYNLVLGTVTNSNLARGRSATATSTEFSGVEAAKAFDGNTSTRWSSRYADPQLIYVDLGSAKTFNQVVLRWETAYARRYGVYYWTGIEWANLFWTNSGDGGNDTINFNSVRAQYVAMYGVQRSTSYGYSLWEFEVYDNSGLPLPIVPPDPEGKAAESNIDPVTPLPPTSDGKDVLLIGDGDTGQENMPLAETNFEPLQATIQSGVPVAHLFYPISSTLITDAGQTILFQGEAADNDDSGNAIVAYRWLSTLDGQIGATDTFTVTASSLSAGEHTITFQAQDNEGVWSEPVTTTLQIDVGESKRQVYLPLVTR